MWNKRPKCIVAKGFKFKKKKVDKRKGLETFVSRPPCSIFCLSHLVRGRLAPISFGVPSQTFQASCGRRAHFRLSPRQGVVDLARAACSGPGHRSGSGHGHRGCGEAGAGEEGVFSVPGCGGRGCMGHGFHDVSPWLEQSSLSCFRKKIGQCKVQTS
jgi:hypothetical protein